VAAGPATGMALLGAAVWLACTPARAAEDAGACHRSMVRTPFTHAVPAPKFRDPRTQLPAEMTVQQRRELHPVLWPSEMSVRFTVRQWPLERNFACLEEGFADLEATQPRLLMGAAWEARGGDDAVNVSPNRMQAFRNLNAAAMKQLSTLSPAATRTKPRSPAWAATVCCPGGATRPRGKSVMR